MNRKDFCIRNLLRRPYCHPGRAKTLIHLVSDLARKRKVDVVLTTHNAILLNALSKDDLAGVEIVYRDDNEGNGRFIPLI